MAFRSDGPVTLTFPPFRGAVRRIIIIAVCAFIFFAILGMGGSANYAQVVSWFKLQPSLALSRAPWQLFTYAFMPESLLGSAFAMLTLWMFGTTLESERGTRWFTEYFLVASAGGALLASVLSFAFRAAGIPQLGPDRITAGLWPVVLAVMLAFARFHGEEPIRLYFLFTLKAKQLVAIYLLLYLVLTLTGGDRFGALTALCAAAAGFLYLRFAPRQGIGFASSEGIYGLRNAYYRAKRRRAARKFTVYMREQGKDVSIDDSGRYVDPSGKPRDPNDRRWMN